MAVYGSFTSDGVSKLLDIVAGAKYLKLTNSSAAGQFEWYEGYAAGTATNVSNGAAITSNGVTAFLSSENVLGPAITGSAGSPGAVEKLAPNAQVNTTNPHGLKVGDVVKITNTTNMRQIAGMYFKVLTIGGGPSPTGFTIPIDTSAFANFASTVTVRKLQLPELWLPRQKFITAITRGSSTVVSTSTDHGYSVGQIVSLQVPAEFGSVELNGRSGRVSAINSSLEFTVDIDSSAATAFAFPASGAVPFSFAMVEPAGSKTTLAQGNVTPGASENAGVRGLLLGSSVIGSAGNVIYYYALT